MIAKVLEHERPNFVGAIVPGVAFGRSRGTRTKAFNRWARREPCEVRGESEAGNRESRVFFEQVCASSFPVYNL